MIGEYIRKFRNSIGYKQ